MANEPSGVTRQPLPADRARRRRPTDRTEQIYILLLVDGSSIKLQRRRSWRRRGTWR